MCTSGSYWSDSAELYSWYLPSFPSTNKREQTKLFCQVKHPTSVRLSGQKEKEIIGTQNRMFFSFL